MVLHRDTVSNWCYNLTNLHVVKLAYSDGNQFRFTAESYSTWLVRWAMRRTNPILSHPHHQPSAVESWSDMSNEEVPSYPTPLIGHSPVHLDAPCPPPIFGYPIHLDAPIHSDAPYLQTPLYNWMPLYIQTPHTFECPPYVWTPTYVWMPHPHMSACPHVVRCPHTFGHPHMFRCPPYVWTSAICLDAPYIQMPLYIPSDAAHTFAWPTWLDTPCTFRWPPYIWTLPYVQMFLYVKKSPIWWHISGSYNLHSYKPLWLKCFTAELHSTWLVRRAMSNPTPLAISSWELKWHEQWGGFTLPYPHWPHPCKFGCPAPMFGCPHTFRHPYIFGCPHTFRHPHTLGCPHMFGHPNMFGSPTPYVWMPHMFRCPIHLDYPICSDAPICLDTPYVWIPPYIQMPPYILDTPHDWMPCVHSEAPIHLDPHMSKCPLYVQTSPS